MDRYCQFALIAAQMAMEQSGFDMEALDKSRCAVIVGSGIGGFSTIEAEHRKLLEIGPRRVSPLAVPMLIANMAAGTIAIRYGFTGSCITPVTACATGSHAIGEAFRMIKHGYADVVVAGGAEAAITPFSIASFSNMGAVTHNTDPKRASIPFDKERNGFVMGEGSSILILESFEHAKRRGAKPLAEVLGYGTTCDAYHVTLPDPEGKGGAAAMKQAIGEAGIEAKDVSYINAHGTSTTVNDKVETLAIKSTFGSAAYKMPISSTKSMMGHLLGAAGAIEGALCVYALRDGFVPATIGSSVFDPDCDLDYVFGQGREEVLSYALSNSLGFGGHNASLLFGRV
jgi:3-oxoacyl-[acyl-carrier-protein] synthase II